MAERQYNNVVRVTKTHGTACGGSMYLVRKIVHYHCEVGNFHATLQIVFAVPLLFDEE